MSRRRRRAAVLVGAVVFAWVSRAMATPTPTPPLCPTPPPTTATPCSCPSTSSSASSANACSSHQNELIVAPIPTVDDRQRVIDHLQQEDVEFEYVKRLDVFVVRAVTKAKAAELIPELRQIAEHVEPNYGYHQADGVATPNDPLYPQQWAFKPTPGINASAAWPMVPSLRTPAVIGIVDSGVDASSVEMNSRTWKNKKELDGASGIDDDGNGWKDDVYGVNTTATGTPVASVSVNDGTGHGTRVASIVSAQMNNEMAMVGVAPSSRFVTCKASVEDCATGADVAECFEYLNTLKTNGVKLVAVNVSLAGNGCSCTVESQIRKARANGLLVVAAAGNNGTSNDQTARFPARHPVSNVIAVAAGTTGGGSSAYNYGKRSVHLFAPGVDIVALKSGGVPDAPGVEEVDGTSFAAPFVTGVLALLRDDGVSDWRQLRNRVLAGGVPMSSANTNKTITGRRLRAADTNGRGALTCANQVVRRRIFPFTDACRMKSSGTGVVVRVLDVDCAAPVKPTVRSRKSGSTDAWVELGVNDDGVYPDEASGDGEWAGLWKWPATTGDYKIVVQNPDSPTSEADLLKVIRIP